MPSAKNKVQPQKKSHEHELDTKGVYQLTNGTWAFRFCKSVKGKNVYKRASTDSKGNPLLTQRDAILAREEAMIIVSPEEVNTDFCGTLMKIRRNYHSSMYWNHYRSLFAYMWENS